MALDVMRRSGPCYASGNDARAAWTVLAASLAVHRARLLSSRTRSLFVPHLIGLLLYIVRLSLLSDAAEGHS